ncbi:class I SAM-dependent methyltransferase [Actinocatenispora sera]|uniref:class I SAM-dependent methyltransferase n=1 Tax=Actinocatenispora sera TaxID=390989 RepID=UPI0033D0A680
MTAFDSYERAQWRGGADTFARTFAPLCAYPADALLDAAGVTAGSRTLDVGTGTGTVAALALARGAVVTAVDADSGMAAAARSAAPGAAVRVGALPALPFATGAFDAVVANFVLNHVGVPAAAVAELARLTRPGGRIAVTIWPYPPPRLQSLLGEAVRAVGAAPVALPRLAAEHDFARTVAGLSGLLAAGGLTEVTGRQLDWRHRTTVADWWAGAEGGIGAASVLLAAQPAATRDRIRAELDRLAEPYRGTDGVCAIPTAALLATGTVPG